VAWKFERDEVARYRIDQTKKAANKQSLVKVPPAWPVAAENIKDKTSYKEPITENVGLIFRYAFSIPAGANAKGVSEISEKFKSIGGHSIAVLVNGKVKIRSSGKKTIIEGQVQFSQNGKSKKSEIKQGQLTWTTLFDSKKGVVLSCNFDFSLEYKKYDKKKDTDHHYVAAGRIILVGRERPKPAKFKKGVAGAIQKGSRWLKDELKKNMSSYSMGRLALSIFALLRSGVPPKDGVIQQGFQKLSTMTPERTYDVAVYIMALEARSVKRVPPKGSSSVPRYERKRVGKNDLRKIQELATWLVNARIVGYGRWDYTAVGGMKEDDKSSTKKTPQSTNASKRFDNSVTQFAVLSLHAAHRAGAKIDPVVWHEIFEHFKKNQSASEGSGVHRIHKGHNRPRMGKKKREGGTVSRGEGVATEENPKVKYRGWSYTTGNAYGSMTNAGLSSLAIAASMLEAEGAFSSEQSKEFKRMSRQGLAWEAKNYTVTLNPKKGGNNHYYYYMYSLEKACELLGVEGFDGRSWYDDGAGRLLVLQEKDGSWERNNIYTSFALIFLNRATLRTTVNILKRRRATGERDGTERTAVSVKGAGGTVDLNNLTESMIGASRSEQKKLQKWFASGLVQLQDADRPLVMPGLIELLQVKETKSFARRQLRAITWDSGMKTPDDFLKWFKHWRSLDKAGEQYAYGRIPFIKETLTNKNRILRQVAMLAAARLMAVELVKDIAVLLDSKKEASLATNCLLTIMDQRPENRADAEAWADRDGPAALKVQMGVRQLFKAVRGDGAAIKAVCAEGKKHLPQLTLLVKKKVFKKGAHSLLQAITGQKTIKADKWGAWWRKNQDKLTPQGRLM
jgi:hypothetical protein